MAFRKRKPRNAEYTASPSRRVRRPNLLVEPLECRQLLTAWYVSTAGSATNPGSVSQPFGTIQEAANVAQPGDTVYIFGGTYHEAVTPASSGTAASPITYQPYPGQTVTIDGADPITGWSSYSGSIYQAPQSSDLGEGNNQVFVDGTMVNEARWPNSPANISTPTWATATSVSVVPVTAGTFTTVTIYNSALNQPAGTWVGAVAHIAAGQGWVDQTATIISSSPGSITFSLFEESSYQIPAAGNKFYIVGNFAALTSAGEWYRDPASGTLNLWSPTGDDPAGHTVEAKARDYAFELSGLSNIHISNINVFACTINTDANSNNNVLNGISAQYVSHSIGVTPDTQDPWGAAAHPHTTGIILNGTGNILENSTVAFSSGDGVFLGGSNNTVENTVIHDVNYEAGDEAGVTTLGTNETVLGNTIYNAGRSGVVSRNTYGSLISHNCIHNVGLQTTDLGGIYTWGTDGTGTEISYNVIYNVTAGGFGAAGIYLDNYSQNFVVDHNLAFNCYNALALNPPSLNNLIVNNTFIGNTAAVNTSGSKVMTGDVLANNIFIGLTTIGTGATATHNLTNPSNPGFVSTSTSNYQLSSTSAAINAGIPELPYTTDYVGSAPDIGAYEYGLAPFPAGATAQPFDPPASTLPAATLITPTVSWSVPSTMQYGTVLDASLFNATSNVPGIFVYNQTQGAVLAAGSTTFSVTFKPLDTVDYLPVTISHAIHVVAAIPTITWGKTFAMIYGTPLGSKQLNATSDVPGTFTYTPAAGTVLGLGTGQTLSLTFTPTDTVDYITVTKTATIDVNLTAEAPPITWPTPAPILYGGALTATQLNATAPVPGTFDYGTLPGKVLSAGENQILAVTFTPTDTIDYATTIATTIINVAQQTPVVTWPAPSAITYGTPIDASELNAASTIPGNFSYSAPAGTILHAGTNKLSVTFTPSDSVDYATVTQTTSITVNKASLTLQADNQSRPYSAPNPVLTYTPIGLVNGDTVSVLANVPRVATAAGTSTVPGTYPIAISGTLTAADYSITLVKGSLTISQASTATTLTSSLQTSVCGQSVTFTARVAPVAPAVGIPSGTVTFFNGSTLLRMVTLSNGVAKLSLSNIAVGTNAITAVYSGATTRFAGSRSSALALVVNPAATSTFLSVSASTIATGHYVTFTAIIRAISPATGIPTGTVTFSQGTSVIGTMTLSSGRAVLTTRTLPTGTGLITATYNGNANFQTSVSPAVKLIVT